MSDEIKLTKQEYDELIAELEDVAEKEYDMIIFSKLFWDSFFTKIVTMCISLKVWTLAAVIILPYILLTNGFITGDNYTQILIVVAPLVIGLREFSKATQNRGSSIVNKFIDTIKQKFNI